MQLSDWEQRPLSSQQIEYAALDAHCLVKIMEKISNATGYDPLSCSETSRWSTLTFMHECCETVPTNL
jgi:ribonuclease D